MSRQELYARRSVDEKFRKSWDEARDIGMSKLEDEAYRRAMDCTDPSDRLLVFMLQHNRKQKYGNRDEPIEQTNVLNLAVTQGGDLYISLRSQISAHLANNSES